MTTRLRSHVASATLLALSAFTAARDAEAQATHQYGGFVNAVWLERLPLQGGQPDAFRVWTAEDGSRIRIYDSVTNAITQQQVITQTPETLHDIYLDPFIANGTENLYGVAVGTNGAAFWWDSQGHNNWKAFTAQPATNKELWAAAVQHEANSTIIWVAGEDLTLKCSQNQGSSWNNVNWLTTPKAGAVTAMDFADWSLAGTRGFAGSDSGQLFFTDNGMDWDVATIHNKPTPSEPLIFWDIDFLPGSTTEAIAVGGRVEGNGDGFAWRTTDGGRNWYRVLTQLDATGQAPVPRTAPTPANPCNGVPGFNRGLYTHTQYATLYGCHMLNDGSALICAYGGQVWKYDPSLGYTIDIHNSYATSTAPLWGCHGDGVNEVWLSGQFGILRRTPDAGASFSTVTPNDTWRLNALAFATPSVGYLAGQSQRIAKTTDGGTTWTEQQAYESGPNHGPSIHEIEAFDSLRVVAITNKLNNTDPGVFWTNDGGATCWNSVNLGSIVGNGTIEDVCSAAIDTTTLQPTFLACGTIASGSSWSGLLKSTDSGATWTQMPAPASNLRLYGIDAVGPTAVVVVGRDNNNRMAAWLTLTANSATPTWNNLFMGTPPSGRLNAVSATGGGLVAVGSGGRIFSYAAGLLVTAPGSAGLTTEALYDVDMASDNGFVWAYAVGNDSTVVRTLLGSGVWETRFAATTDNVRNIAVQPSPGGGMRSWWTGPSQRWGDSTVIRSN
ncbi:MAG: WD40/YVTN/BNR-like repeat-containing protein [Planctomycetota bacterium]